MRALSGVAAALVLAAAGDYAVLKLHAMSGPFLFQGADCAGPRGGGTITTASDPTLGASQWTTFQAAPDHNAVLNTGSPAGQALDASWRFQTNGTVSTVPAVVDGVAYLGSMDGCVYALDAKTGRLLWSFGANNQVMSEPLVSGGLVFFGSGNKGMGVVAGLGTVRGTGVSALYALDARTGRPAWSMPTVGGNMTTPALADGVLYDVGGGKTFYAVSATSGKLLWKLPVGSYVSMSSPTLVGELAVFGGAEPYGLIAVNVQTHRIAWTLPLPQAHSGVDDVTPAASDGVVYVQVPEGSVIKRVVEMAVRASDGQILWQRTLGTDPYNVAQRALGQGELSAHDGEETGVATVVDGVLYVGSPGLGGLWALNAHTGQPVWRLPAALGQGVRTAPAVDGHTLYAASNTTLFVLDAESGALLGHIPLGTFRERTGIMIPCTTAGPLVLGDTLLVGSGADANTIRAIPLRQLP